MITSDAYQKYLQRQAAARYASSTYGQIKTLRDSLDGHLLAQKLAPEFRDALETADAALKNLAKFF